MKLERLSRSSNLLTAALLIAAVVFPVVSYTQHAKAAALNQVMVRFDRIATSTATTGTVCARPATTSANVKTWTVAFPAGYTVSGTAANWQTTNISTTNTGWPSGAVAWPNATAATASVSTQNVTWTNAAVQTMNNTTTYCYNWTSTSAVTTASSQSSANLGSVTTTDNVAATIDTGQYTSPTVGIDQIQVTATVPQAFSFTLSGNTDALGTLATNTVAHSPTARTATIATNAKNGWMAWAKSAAANGGMTSANASSTIASTCNGGTQVGTNTTLSAGTAGYNTGVTFSHATGTGVTGTLSVSSVFDGTATSQGGGLCGSFQTLASSNGTASSDVLTLTNNVAISAVTPPATDYTDTITVVAAGLF